MKSLMLLMLIFFGAWPAVTSWQPVPYTLSPILKESSEIEMISPTHLISEVIIPVLQDLDQVKPGMYSDKAVRLLLGTFAQESDLGFFLKQHPSGPARGIGQMEGATTRDLVDRYLRKPGNEDLQVLILSYYTGTDEIEEEITWNLKLAVALTRLRYWVVPIPIPEDREGQARYWDVHYNANNEDEVEEYLASYDEFVITGFL